MARIILIGEKESIEIGDQKARDLQLDMMSGKLPEFISVGTATTIRSNSIRAVLFQQDVREFEYDLKNSEHKNIILEFEKDIIACKGFDSYCLMMGFVTMTGNVNENSVLAYEDAKRKMRALNQLNEQRHWSRKQEHEQQLSLTQEKCECQEFCKPLTLREFCLREENKLLVDVLREERTKVDFVKIETIINIDEKIPF